jgi:hypothetical protein
VVTQEWIDANGAFAGKVLVDDRIRQRDQQTVIALSTLDTRLFANTGQPLIGTGRCVVAAGMDSHPGVATAPVFNDKEFGFTLVKDNFEDIVVSCLPFLRLSRTLFKRVAGMTASERSFTK